MSEVQDSESQLKTVASSLCSPCPAHPCLRTLVTQGKQRKDAEVRVRAAGVRAGIITADAHTGELLVQASSYPLDRINSLPSRVIKLCEAGSRASPTVPRAHTAFWPAGLHAQLSPGRTGLDAAMM